MEKRFIIVIVALLLSGCPRVESSHGTLRVGMDFTYPPFQMFRELRPGTPRTPGEDYKYKEIDGATWEKKGVSVEIADALAKELQRPLVISALPFRDLVSALQAGRIDLIISSLSITDERRKWIDFSDPYAQTGLAMLVRNNSTIQSLDDLRKPGYKAIVRQSTSAQEFLQGRLPPDRIEVIQESGVGERMAMDDERVAFINDQLMLLRMHSRLPTRTKVLWDLLNREQWGIGIRKGDDALRLQVNAFLAKYRAAGGFQELSTRYLKDAQAFLASEHQPPIFP